MFQIRCPAHRLQGHFATRVTKLQRACLASRTNLNKLSTIYSVYIYMSAEERRVIQTLFRRVIYLGDLVMQTAAPS